jgi:sulfate permease, SulP family
VALPLAMAFAISSGMPPQSGIYTAVVTGFLISALGGSMVQIGGPTGAFVVVVYGIVAKYGIDGLFTCTMMAGRRARQGNSSGGCVCSAATARRSHRL